MNFHPELPPPLGYAALASLFPQLTPFLFRADHGGWSVGQGEDPESCRVLTEVGLAHYHKLSWPFPKGSPFLVPTLPSREVYVRIVNDILKGSGGFWDDTHAVMHRRGESLPVGGPVTGVDVGVGASAIYCLLGAKLFGWRMVGTDIDDESLAIAASIVASNPTLDIDLVKSDPHTFFPEELPPSFSFSMCNPPFYWKDRPRKVHPSRALVGKANEVACVGGEEKFVVDMFRASRQVQRSCVWFTTLCHLRSTVHRLLAAFEEPPTRRERRRGFDGVAEPTRSLVVEYRCGRATLFVVAWSFI